MGRLLLVGDEVNRFQRLLARLSPVAIYRPIKRPSFDVDDKLVTRQIKAAAEHPTNGIKRVLIEDQSDYSEFLAAANALWRSAAERRGRPRHVANWGFDANGSPVEDRPYWEVPF
jgi:hypothetical protein